MRWAVLLLVACSARSRPSSVPAVTAEVRPDPAARAWALRAWVAEARGDEGNAERAWRWTARLDRGSWARVHQGWFLQRQGHRAEATAAFAEAQLIEPSAEAELGLAAVGAPLRTLQDLGRTHPCRVAFLAEGLLRREVEVSCIAQ